MAFTTPWEDMDKERLELEYSPSRWSKRFDHIEIINNHLKVVNEGSALAKKTLDCELGVSYGPGEPGDQQKLDIFGADSLPADAPIYVFIHGGYWQQLNVEQSSYMATSFVKAGAVVISVGYDLCPKVSFQDLVAQVKTATENVIAFAKKRGSRGIYLSGHSAGGHLIATMLSYDWGEDADLIKGAVPISGSFDVRPLSKTYVNDPLGLTLELAWEFSPANHIEEIIQYNKNCKFCILVGGDESPEFVRQSQEMSTALADGGMDVTCTVLPDYDHFSVVEELRDPEYIGCKMIFEFMGIGAE